MKDEDLMELQQRRRLETVRLAEVASLTQQMAQAAGRRDETSVNMLLDMRAEPITQLMEMEYKLRRFLRRLPREDRERAQALLNGANPENPAETAVAQQVAAYQRQLQAVIEMDKRLSLSIGKRKSFYHRRRVQP